MATLLERAKKVSTQRCNRKYTQEHYDLTLAWAKGEITLTQAASAIGSGTKVAGRQSAITLFAYAFREMYRSGMIEIK